MSLLFLRKVVKGGRGEGKEMPGVSYWWSCFHVKDNGVEQAEGIPFPSPVKCWDMRT